MHDGLAEDLPTFGFAFLDETIAAILARKDLGLQRYGTVLQAFNGRDVLVDLRDEVIDGAVYARQALEETGIGANLDYDATVRLGQVPREERRRWQVLYRTYIDLACLCATVTMLIEERDRAR